MHPPITLEDLQPPLNGVVVTLNESWRVIDEELQWIPQHKKGKRWENRTPFDTGVASMRVGTIPTAKVR